VAVRAVKLNKLRLLSQSREEAEKGVRKAKGVEG
jgi:hypothetical protein